MNIVIIQNTSVAEDKDNPAGCCSPTSWAPAAGLRRWDQDWRVLLDEYAPSSGRSCPALGAVR